jgi:hypothetical protein
VAHPPLSSQDCYLDFLNLASKCRCVAVVVVVAVAVAVGVRGLNDEYMNAMCS